MIPKFLPALAFLLLSFLSSAQDYGTVYFYRSGSIKGAAVNYNIYDDTTLIRKMTPGQVFIYHANPGTHQFISKTESKTVLIMTVESGKSYFVECGVSMGVVVGNPAMEQVTSQRGIKAIAKLNPNLTIDKEHLGDFTMDETQFKTDTVRALSNLFQRKRKNGKIRGAIFLVWGVAGLAAGDPAVLPGVITASIISVTGFVQAGKYKPEALALLVKDYQSGKPIPSKIKSKFKEKDFD